MHRMLSPLCPHGLGGLLTELRHLLSIIPEIAGSGLPVVSAQNKQP